MALVLSRKAGEGIVINGNIVIRVYQNTKRKGGGFSVHVEAPKDVPVHREEYAKQIGQEVERAK